MADPTFSVIIPTHNRARILPRAIHSVLAQTFSDFELLVVDDGSTDDTEAVVARHADQRIKYLPRAASGSAAAARNTGIQHAQGRYVCFLDDDDEFLPRFLERTHRGFQSAPDSVGLSWCGTCLVRDTPKGEVVLGEQTWRPEFATKEEAYLSFLYSRAIGTGNGITVRRACFDTVGYFDEALGSAEDTDFLIRFVRHYDFLVIPDILVKVHKHSGPRLTTYDCRMADAYERIISKHQDTLERHPEILSAKHYKTGWMYFHGGNRAKGRYHILRSLHLDPIQPKRYLTWIMLEALGPLGPDLHNWISTWKRSLGAPLAGQATGTLVTPRKEP